LSGESVSKWDVEEALISRAEGASAKGRTTKVSEIGGAWPIKEYHTWIKYTAHN